MINLFAEAPALPLHAAGKYVAGAYIVFMLVVVIYVAIMAVRLQRNQRELLELKALLDERERGDARLTGSGVAETGTAADSVPSSHPHHPEQVA